ncbi:MAG: DNA-directed RNA polymerase subunit omega [Bacteroidales bacterium]|jgi:DNA-directed RNA polymerase subunit K/omega|nr:DNA-directed RNA polymerase subunit omega [Bacteroidales bacterium]MDD4235490.1 DNA-directed RNA polymerase subunit omega [Bacteroidales bacterium]
MDLKKAKGAPSTITRNMSELITKVDNIYEAVVICSKRANQISIELKIELTEKLAEFASYSDNLEEVFENREQIEVSKFYERLPKPVLISLEEFLSDELYYKLEKPEEQENNA